MVRNITVSLAALLALCLVPYVGVGMLGLNTLFGTVLPYAAVLVFAGGIVWKVLGWARAPVPFRIPTTCGQQKSLPWIKPNPIDNPFSKIGVFFRMAFEVLCFRSLFRNTKMSALKGEEGHGKLAYRLEIFLWAGALAFHYAMLVVVIRHMRFFMEPVPAAIQWLENLDGFFKVEILADIFPIGLPAILASGFVLFFALAFLLGRRVLNPMVRYVSLLSDYFPLLLLLGIAGTGILMRYFTKVDILGVKELTMGIATFRPAIPEGVGSLFYIHFFLVCILIAYLPFSKIMHVAGVFLSPTRNLTTDTRRNRHVNPWNPAVETHTYEEYEDEFREKMAGVGLPLDKKES